MGADIYSRVETRTPGSEWWDSAIRIHDIVYRQYGMFASLFGVRNGGNGPTAVGRFRAIAAGRGAPSRASEFYAEEVDSHGGGVGETWVLWSELATIDWDEEGEMYIGDEPPHLVSVEPGSGRRRERRGDYLNGGWATLFTLMAALAKQFGADNVRLSVWFDHSINGSAQVCGTGSYRHPSLIWYDYYHRPTRYELHCGDLL